MKEEPPRIHVSGRLPKPLLPTVVHGFPGLGVSVSWMASENSAHDSAGYAVSY